MSTVEPVSRRAVVWTGAVVAGLVVVMILALATVMIAHREPDTPGAAACRRRLPPTGPTAGTADGPDIVEQGHTRVTYEEFSMGAILRNTTDKVAYRSRVTFDVADRAGRSVVWEPHRPFMVQEVPVVPPGAEVAVGDTLAVVERAWRTPRPAVRVSITVAVGHWLAAGDGRDGLGPVTATVVAGAGERDAHGDGSVRYNAVSANCAPLVPTGYSMVFRDRAGRIVGGSLSRDRTHRACDPGYTGWHSALSSLGAIPASADLDRTEVTPYCDLARPDN